MKILFLKAFGVLHDSLPILLMCAMIVFIVYTQWPRSTPEVTIPNAAAEEARLSCSYFAGLDSFTVKAAGKAASGAEALSRYDVAATCKSRHKVSVTIAVKE